VPAKNVAKTFIEKSAKKRFLYSHEYHAQKMGEKKPAIIFPEHTNCIRKKCWEKNLREKVRNNVFYIYTNIVTKMGGNNA